MTATVPNSYNSNRNHDQPSLISRLAAMNTTNVNPNSFAQNNSDIQIPSRREVQSFESECMPPPVSHSSVNKKRKNVEKEPPSVPTKKINSDNDTDTSSLIPNSQDSVEISDCNVVVGRRQRKKRF